MKRFFGFRSSAPGGNGDTSGGSRTPPALGKGKAYWEPPRENDPKRMEDEEAKGEPQTPRNLVFRPVNCYPEEDSAIPQLRRSVSLSSAAYVGRREHDLGVEACGSSSSSGRDSTNHSAECSGHCHYSTPKRHTRTKSNLPAATHLDAVDMPDSARYQCSSGSSPCSSPVPLRCRAARLTNILGRNKTLDLYIDREHQEMKLKNDFRMQSSDAESDCYLAENRVRTTTRRPPRAQSTAPSSPTYSKDQELAYSLKEVKDNSHHFCMQDSTIGDVWPVSPQKHTRRNLEKRWKIFPGKSVMGLQDKDSVTTVETGDIYVDSSNAQATSNSNIMAHHFCTDTIPPNANMNDFSADREIGFEMPSCFLENHSMGQTMGNMTGCGPQENITDEELYEKHKEVEQMFNLLSKEDLEMKELRNSSLNSSSLLQTIMNITEHRRHLVLELSSQIKCRIAERSSNNERLEQAKLEVDIRTRRLEKEKSELQSSLEKELDRRSSSWSLKLEKFQSEELRLRGRVRELAEQNVSLQRETSLLKGNEIDSRSRIMSSEMQLNNLMASMDETKTENQDLRQALSELQERFKGAEEEQNCIRISYKGREKENKELQKVVARLQRTINEQEKTISGLRQGYNKEIGKLSAEGSDNSSKLKIEQLRLTGVEQMLRKEVESCRKEMESLRHENICLLDRLQCTGNGYGSSSSKLDKELHARVDCLKTKGLSLLNDNVLFSGELLGLMKRKQYDDFDGYYDCTVKYQNLRSKIENFNRSFQTILTIMDEKSSLKALDRQSHTVEDDSSRPSKSQELEDGLVRELKAETLLTGVLREKLYSKELELEQLEADLASSARVHDVLQTETQRLQDELSHLTLTVKDMEHQLKRKDESVNQLQHDLQECTKELTATRSILVKVSEERDHMWEQVKHSKETIMLLNHEVDSLKKRIEVLDEDIHIKEGEIDILKDSLADKPFDIICSPKSVETFAVGY